MMDDKSDLHISRFIKAPPATVWRAWSVPANLEKWWIPHPIECRVITLDLRPGGGFETQMREGSDAFQQHLDACFLDVEPEQRIVFSTALSAGWRPAEPWLNMTAVITLEAEGDGTQYVARVLHKSPDDSRKHEELGFFEGWGTTLQQLAELAERPDQL